MKLTLTLAALAVLALAVSPASAQHFDRQRREAIARQAAAQQHLGHHRAVGGHHGSHHVASRHGGSGHWGGPTTRNRFYRIGSPYCRTPYYGSGVYIHREIYLGR